jgi:lipoic acid synthetase
MAILYLNLGRAPYAEAMAIQEDHVLRVRESGGAKGFLLLVEHDPPVITLGRRGRQEKDVLASPEALAAAGIEVHRATRGGQATYHGPGQLVGYPVLDLRAMGLTVRQYVHRLEETLIRTAARFGVAAGRRDGQTGVWAEEKADLVPLAAKSTMSPSSPESRMSPFACPFPAKLAAIGVAVRERVAYHGFALNVCTDLDLFGLIVPCGMPQARATSLAELLGRRIEVEEVKPRLLECFAEVFQGVGRATGCTRNRGAHRASNSLHAESGKPLVAGAGHGPSVEDLHAHHPAHPLPSAGTPATRGAGRLPIWLRHGLPSPGRSREVRRVLEGLGLATVCEAAHCPNRPECFARGTATFLILGDRCTRNCRFCAVAKGPPLPPREDEPLAVAQAAKAMGLSHVVVTSVTRDDLPDGGAAQFARTLSAVRRAVPRATVEVLTPDFGGSLEALAAVQARRPEVFSHNVETVPRLYGRVRPRAEYARSLELLRRAKNLAGSARPGGRCPPRIKSGLMVGLGETRREVLEVLRDLRTAGCDAVTLGQYLQPTPQQLPVSEFLPPQAFVELEAEATAIGFPSVAAGPFVRSSYRAGEILHGQASPRAAPPLRHS